MSGKPSIRCLEAIGTKIMLRPFAGRRRLIQNRKLRSIREQPTVDIHELRCTFKVKSAAATPSMPIAS